MTTETKQEFQLIADAAGERIVETLREELAALKAAQDADDATAEDEARDTINSGPLSVEVRSDWHTISGDTDAGEYRLLMSWGGPASQITGELNGDNEPESAYFEYQDWGTPWTRARLSGEQEDVLLAYAREFYFGE